MHCWGVAVRLHRTDAEAAMNQTLSDMKNTLDERMKEKLALEEEKDYLKETVGKLQGQLNQIQAEVANLPVLSVNQIKLLLAETELICWN